MNYVAGMGDHRARCDDCGLEVPQSTAYTQGWRYDEPATGFGLFCFKCWPEVARANAERPGRRNHPYRKP